MMWLHDATLLQSRSTGVLWELIFNLKYSKYTQFITKTLRDSWIMNCIMFISLSKNFLTDMNGLHCFAGSQCHNSNKLHSPVVRTGITNLIKIVFRGVLPVVDYQILCSDVVCTAWATWVRNPDSGLTNTEYEVWITHFLLRVDL